MSRLEDRISSVAGSNQYLFFADIHNQTAALDILAQPENMAALRCAGHEVFGSELFHVGQNQIFEAYEQGQISDATMRDYIINSPSNLEGDMGVTDSRSVMERYFDIVKNAKDAGLEFRGLAAYEGIMDREEVLPILQNVGEQDLAMLMAIERAPGYLEANTNVRKMFVEQIGEQLGLEGAEIADMQFRFGNVNPGPIEMGYTAEIIEARLQADAVQADAIESMADGRRMTVLYGGLHMWRTKGDLDTSIGEDRTAVISAFDDSRTFWQDQLPEWQREMREAGLDITLENAGDYQFDAKTNTWYDSTTDTNTIVSVPDGMGAGTFDVTPTDPAPTGTEMEMNPFKG